MQEKHYDLNDIKDLKRQIITAEVSCDADGKCTIPKGPKPAPPQVPAAGAVGTTLILTSADLLDHLFSFSSVNSNSLFVCLLRYFLA